MLPQSAGPVGVLEINRDEAAEIPVACAAVYVHPVVDEDGGAWPEMQAREWLGLFRSPCGFVSKPGTRALSRSVALQMGVPGRNATLHFLVASSMVDGSGAQGTHARHWKCANVQRRNWTLMNSFACSCHRHFWSLGNRTLEVQHICVGLLVVSICKIADAFVLSRPQSQITDECCLGGKDDKCLGVVFCGKNNNQDDTRNLDETTRNQDETTLFQDATTHKQHETIQKLG